MRYIVLDTETTGLEPSEGHRIIEIGCVELINRKITGKHFHRYLNPQRNIDEGALAVHGITQDFLQNKPIFADIVDELIAFIRDAILIIHNAPFDTAFINHEFNLTKKSWKPLASYCQIIDTLALARQLHAGQRNSLDALCKRYTIDNSHRELHGALLDAHLLAKVYLAMTGGQGSLFDESVIMPEKKQITHDISFAHSFSNMQNPLRVIYADNNELELHQQKLKQIASKGQCAWLEENEGNLV